MSEPDVTVVIGAYEAMPYLTKCLDSVAAQSLAAERIEIVAVDDGSTDGSGAYLEEFAARTPIPMRVVRQQNSGGPSGPRNVGLGLARGRWVFFLDADDHLGPEALERMTAMGDRNGTDVVLGKVVGVNRGAPKSMWGRNLDRTDVFSSNIKYTLSAQKLFRRSMLEQHGIRFDESLITGEDALFTLDAYLRADGVSVVADHVCYYLVRREDGKHATRAGDHTRRFESARALMELIAARVPAGERRDLLMVRPFVITVLPQFGPAFLKQDEAVRKHKLELAAPLLAEFWTPGVSDRLKVNERLRLHLAAAGRPDLLADVIRFVQKKNTPEMVLAGRGDRVYLRYPHFRDAKAGVPDSLYVPTVREAAVVTGTVPRRAQPRTVRVMRRVARRILRGSGKSKGRPAPVAAA
ncbi:glycosyltransferase family 2 protein [Streptomyces sp. NPDC058045]|uniref:glycosyltransferase family 2 protein n=1 Tax=Streptomyces sp. NPDC058045 TaxID=3346311 RepID=UPI0036E91C0A